MATIENDSFAPAALPRPSSDDPVTFLVPLDSLTPDKWPALAQATCGERTRCKFLGWRDPAAVPARAGLAWEPAALNTMSFSYLRDRGAGVEKQLWNCQLVSRPAASCMRRALPAPPPAPSAARSEVPPLSGVRRTGDPAPAPSAE